jgi:hypothetical protein
MNGTKKIIIICVVVFLGGYILNTFFDKLNLFEGMAVSNPTTNKNLGVGEGHCSKDGDCGPGLSCFTTPNTNPPGVTGVPEATAGKAGARVCYQKDTPTWNGNLVVGAAACAKFDQDFPCVGKNMMTGPHSNDCLNDMWKKSGCDGKVEERVKTIGGLGKQWMDTWQRNAYTIDQDSMYNKSRIMRSTDYFKANPATKVCRGKPVDSCDDKYVGGTKDGRPMDCLRKAYKSSGCTRPGKAHPDNMKQWTNASGTKGIKSQAVKDLRTKWDRKQVYKYYQDMKSSATKSSRKPRADFGMAIYANEMCHGNQPKVPFNKPCWKDFTSQILSHKNAELSDDKNELKLDKMNWKGLQNPKALNQKDGTLVSNELASIQTQLKVNYDCKPNLKDMRRCVTSKCPVYQPPGSTRRMSLTECKNECSSEPDCVQMNYFGKKRRCVLLKGKPMGMGVKRTNKRDRVTTCKPTRPSPHTNKWGNNWSITKGEYRKSYFPFWNFVFKSRERKSSKPSWIKFKDGMLKVPGVTNKTIGGADSLLYDKYGYFADLFRRMKFNYRKPMATNWEKVAGEGDTFQPPPGGKIRYGHPALGWLGSGGTAFKEKEYGNNPQPTQCNTEEFGRLPPGSQNVIKACYLYNPGKGTKICPDPSLVPKGQCSEVVTKGADGKNECDSNNIGAEPTRCEAPGELGRRVPYVITQALFETDDFPYWAFERTMTRNQ